MTMAYLGDIISALEQLATDVENKSRDNPDDVEQVLQKALTRTTELICDAIPEKEQRGEWLSELSSIGDSAKSQFSHTNTPKTSRVVPKNPALEGSDLEQCTCPLKPEQIRNSPTVPPTLNFVQCIHGCDALFCSATCRKRRMREHRPKCHALKRKEVLKKVGLNSSEELF